MTDYTKIGKKIDELRKERGWTKTFLGEKLGLSEPRVFRHIRTGKMSVGSLIGYAQVFGCSVNTLLGDAVKERGSCNEMDILAFYPYNLAAAVFKAGAGSGEYTDKEALKAAVYKVYVPALLECMEELPEREQEILRLRFMTGRTYRAIGDRYGLTKERIRVILNNAVKKLYEKKGSWVRDISCTPAYRQAKAARPETEDGNIPEKTDAVPDRVLSSDAGFNELGLPPAATMALYRHGIRHLSDLHGRSLSELRRLRNFGKGSIKKLLFIVMRCGGTVESDTVFLPLVIDGAAVCPLAGGNPDRDGTEEIIKERDALLEEVERLKEEIGKLEPAEPGRTAEPQRQEQGLRIDRCGLLPRTGNALRRSGIAFLRDLDGMSVADVRKLRCFGARCEDDLMKKLKEYGVRIENDMFVFPPAEDRPGSGSTENAKGDRAWGC